VGIDYLNFEQWIYDQYNLTAFQPDSFFSSQNIQLEALYYGIKSQAILINFNTGQSFENYYESSELEQIRQFCLSLVNETELYWYAENDDHSDISDFTTTRYVFEILTAIGWNMNLQDYGEISEKLGRYTESSLANLSTMSLSQKADCLELAQIMNWNFSLGQFPFTHNEMRTILTQLLDENYVNQELLSIYKSTERMNTLYCSFHYSDIQEIGSGQTYSFQFWSLFSLESVQNIQLSDDTNVFSEWHYIGSRWIGEVIVGAQISDLSLWTPLLEILWDGQEYSTHLSINIHYSLAFDTFFTQDDNNSLWNISVTVFGPIPILKILDPFIYVAQSAQNLTWVCTNVSLTSVFGLNQVEYSLNLYNLVLPNYTVDIICDFREWREDNLTFSGVFISDLMPEIPNDPERDILNYTDPYMVDEEFDYIVVPDNADGETPVYDDIDDLTFLKFGLPTIGIVGVAGSSVFIPILRKKLQFFSLKNN
jgi:hypothetical protein